MKRMIQHPLRWALVPCGLAIAAGLLWTTSAPSQPAPKYPVVESATHKSYIEKIDDKAPFEMQAIPGGTFLMGSPADEKGRGDDEGPQHPVTVKPFWMAKMEVAWDQYDIYWENMPKGPPPRPELKKKLDKESDALTSPTPPFEDQTFGYGKETFPCISITHHAAMEYCRWLSKKTGKMYRLPTEAEWEWACRAGTTTRYYFGDDEASLDEHAWYEKNSDDSPHPVGKKKPNPWGLHDMHGNVAEWCLDSYQKDFYSTLSKNMPTLMPVRMPTANRFPDVVRGGSWLDGPDKCRSAVRRGSDQMWMKRDPQGPQSIWWMTEAYWVGFRVVRAVEEDERLKGVRSKVTWWSN